MVRCFIEAIVWGPGYPREQVGALRPPLVGCIKQISVNRAVGEIGPGMARRRHRPQHRARMRISGEVARLACLARGNVPRPSPARWPLARRTVRRRRLCPPARRPSSGAAAGLGGRERGERTEHNTLT